MEFLVKGYFKWQGYFLFIHFFPINRNMTGVCRCRTQGVFAAASVIFCPDDGFHSISAILIQPGILQCVLSERLLFIER